MVLMLVFAVSILAGCAPTSTPVTETPKTEAPTAAKIFKVALVLPGSIKDAGWNQAIYDALMADKVKYGLETSYQESVSQSEVKDVLSNYASGGYDLVIAGDLNFTDPTNEVAPQFPKVMFGIAGGSSAKGDNVVSVSATNWESTYLAGTLAGLITKTNKIGMLTADNSPNATKMLNGFKAGAIAQNPKVQMVSAFVGSWDDVVKGKELVASMISQGADVIYTQAGQTNEGAIQAAKEGGVLAIGGVVDMYSVAPDTVVSSAIASPGAYVDTLIKWLVEGNLQAQGGKTLFLGVKAGVEDLAPFHNFDSKIPQETKDKIAKARQALIDGIIPTPASQ